jgi:stage IV sporulation protein FB
LKGSGEDYSRAMLAIYGAFILLIFPFSWILSMALAAFIHEMGHWAAIRACKMEVNRFRIGLTGAKMETAGLTAGQELFCSFAGPAVGFLAVFTVRWFPRLALCALGQTVFNLLPVYPLDGGRCLQCLCRLLGLPKKITSLITCLTLCVLGILSLYAGVVMGLGFFPILGMVTLCLKCLGKRPCKQRLHPI